MQAACKVRGGGRLPAVVVPLLVAVPLAWGSPAAKPPKAADLLLDPAVLEKQLVARELRILDTRPRADYARGHIPGAVWVDAKRWQALALRKGGLHDAGAWGKEVGSLGVGPATAVVVYGKSLPETARTWWTLKYLGLCDVAILDGGWDLWAREKRPTSTDRPAVRAVRFEPKFQADRLEEMAPLKKALRSGKVTVVDARTRGEFTGTDVRGKRGGHIPGARHLEWKDLLSKDGRFKSPEQLRALSRERGIRPEQTAVTC